MRFFKQPSTPLTPREEEILRQEDERTTAEDLEFDRLSAGASFYAWDLIEDGEELEPMPEVKFEDLKGSPWVLALVRAMLEMKQE